MTTQRTTKAEELTEAQLIAFLRLLAHDLKSGIGAVAMWQHLLETGGDEADTPRAQAGIRQGLAALDRTAQDLGDLARRLAGIVPVDDQEVDLVRLLAAAVARVNGPGNPRGVLVELAVPAAPVPRVRGGEEELGLAFERLMAWAVARAPSGARIRIEVAADPAGVSVRVPAGAGEGPVPILEPRQQVAGIAGSHGGIGLALPLARDTMIRHGGELEIAGAAKESVLEARLPVGTKAPRDQTPR